MKTDEKLVIAPTGKAFHTVDFFRGVKAQIAKETLGMSFEEFKRYLASKLASNKPPGSNQNGS